MFETVLPETVFAPFPKQTLPCRATLNLRNSQELSGRHRGIASLVFSHHAMTQRISATRVRIARISASHRIPISVFTTHRRSHRIAARIARYGPLSPREQFSGNYFLVGSGVQSCELKKNIRFFKILVTALIGTLVGLAGPPGRHAWLNHRGVLEFLCWVFWGLSIGNIYGSYSTAEKHTPKIRGKKMAKKSARKISFSLRFALCFFAFLWRPSPESDFDLWNRTNSRRIRPAKHYP